MTTPLDLRLVPAALTAWSVTAAGMQWRIGSVLVLGCGFVAVVAAGVAVIARRCDSDPADSDPADDDPHPVDVRRSVCTVLIAAGVVGAGFALAISLRADQVRDHPLAQRIGDSVAVLVVPTESPRTIAGGRQLIKADLRRFDDQESRGRVLVFAPALGYEQAVPGQPLAFRATVGRPKRADLTVVTLTAGGRPELGEPSAIQRAAAEVRSRFAAQSRAGLSPGSAAMLPALVLGDTSALTRQTTEQFRTAGLTHLTAVSGANVTIVCGAVLFAVGWIGPRWAVALAGLALLAFVIVVQPSASVLRAAVMGAIALLAVVSARRRQAIPALAGSVIVLLIAAPHLAVDAGFALSVCATAALVVIAPRWSQRLIGRGWPKPLADALCVAVAAHLVTAPLVAGISGELSLVAVAANLAVAPVIPPITVLGTAAAVLAGPWPLVAELLIRFTGPEVWWLLWVSRSAAALPLASVPVPAGFSGVLLVSCCAVAIAWGWRWRQVRRLLGVAVLVAAAWAVSGI